MRTPYDRSEEHTRDCPHDNSFEVDQGIYCADCQRIIAVYCDACGGEGMVYEDDYECDWINHGHDFITCPRCGGSGWNYD